MTGKVALTDMCSNLSKTLSHPILGCNCISHQLLLVIVLSGTAQKWTEDDLERNSKGNIKTGEGGNCMH